MNWLKKKQDVAKAAGEDESSINSDDDTGSEDGKKSKAEKTDPLPPMKDAHDVTALAKEALRIRSEMAASWPEELSTIDFAESAIGTVDTHKRFGVSCDFIKAKPTSKLGKKVVNEHFKRKEFGCGITKKFTRHDAVMMVRMWCHKMQHYADILEASADKDTYTFSDECVASYQPLDRFQVWRDTLDPNSQAHLGRLRQIDELKPRYLMNDLEFARA